jgi:dipeptidyl aminopeptidase/acylaminoacyl peptidase
LGLELRHGLKKEKDNALLRVRRIRMNRNRVMMFCSLTAVILFTAGWGEAEPLKKLQDKRPFTLDDALSLETLNFNPRSGISAEGQQIAYTIKHGYSERSKSKTPYRYVPRKTYVYVQSLRTGKKIQVTRGEENSWAPALSPDSTKLAFYVWRNNRICIGVWRRDSQSIRYYELEKLKGKGPLIWDKRATRLLYSPTENINTGPVEPYEAHEKVIVRESWKEDPYEKRFRGMWQQQLWVLDLESGRGTPIIPEDITFYSRTISPDGERVAVSEVIKQKVMIYRVPSYVKLDIYSLDGKETKTIFSDKVTTTPYAWSPDSESIVFVDDGKAYLYSVRDGNSRQFSPADLKVSGFPLWSPDGKLAFLSAVNTYCLINTNSGKSKAFSLDIPYSKQPLFWDTNGTGLYFKVVDVETGKQGIYRYDTKRDKATKIMMKDSMIRRIGQAGDVLVMTLQTSTMSENIWVLDKKTGSLSQLTDINKQVADCSFGKSELVRWTSHSGDPLKGVLLYPAGYNKGQRYPTVLWVYETFSSQLHSFYSRIFYYLQILTNSGYAVFMPDIKFTMGETAKSFKGSIVPALDKLEEIGVADGNFGVLGHSFGGYAANIIVTQTQRFKAAIASAGQSDWISRQGAPGHFWSLGDERGQARLGGDLKDIPEIFVKNSAVFYLDNVTTPLMIVHGTKDFCVQFRQAEEMYYGLKNLGKTALLVAYPGEGHLGNGTAEWVIRDFWKRALSWYDKYLK